MAPAGRGERLTRSLVRRYVDADSAYRTPLGFSLKIDPRDHFQPLMLTGRFDRPIVELSKRLIRPGDVVVDAGAHIGYMTLVFANAAGTEGRVLAFECDPRLLPILRENVAINGLRNVDLDEQALHDGRSESVDLHLTEQLGWSTVGTPYWGEIGKTSVSAVGLDGKLAELAISPQRLGLIKLDVEGAEPAALEGMPHTLAETSAALLVEVSGPRLAAAGRSRDELLELLADYSYRPYSPQPSRRGVRWVAGAEPGVGEDVLFLKRADASRGLR